MVHDLVKISFYNILVSETEVFIIGHKEIHRFDFGSFECFRNEAKSVTLSLPWRSVWRSKGVDEEPLEPLHHVSVYKEVLEYFQQLGMNCQTAIKCFAVCDLNSATFTLGDNFIAFKVRGNPEIIIYDYNKDRRSHEINYKTVQISITTHLSVMGKTIQLIDSATGNVIKEAKLERDVLIWHFNCNLLVCVCQIMEHKHLLSIWRVENSSNLNHMKDVTVDDYHGSPHVDEQFIVFRAAGTMTYNFISTKTFLLERSLSFRVKNSAYHKGYLFLQNKNLVRILDVTSGTFLRDIRVNPSDNKKIFRVNSNYVVLATLDSTELFVYDLKCLKETDTVPTHLLLTTIDLRYNVKEMRMNDAQIFCLCWDKMCAVDLKPIDCLRCPNLVD